MLLRSPLLTYQILSIDFDFDGSELSPFERDSLSSDIIGSLWEASDEEDLVEELTCVTGWCVKSLDYRIALA